ncbi:hypothetical protein C8R45DRAFT_974945 [Mycena sanguinolenta]|nr:hypothetical protein C8R45DRAFT_974945 [Mycena sanguinolenta]
MGSPLARTLAGARIGVCPFTRFFVVGAQCRDVTHVIELLLDNKGCKISPGDPASSLLDQWEEHSAKIVFENPHERALFDVCLDHPSLQ